MKCNACGFNNQEGSLFCSECGTRLAMRCPNCGKPVPARSRFCNICGHSLAPSERNEPITHNSAVEQNADKEPLLAKLKQPNTRIIISVICIIAAVVLLIIGFSTQDSYYWYQDELIGYFLGFIAFGLGALFAYKPSFFSKKKNVGIVLIVIGVLVFLFGVVCSGKSRHGFDFDAICWDDFKVNFFVGLIISAGGLFLCILDRDREKHSAGSFFSYRHVGSILIIGFSLFYSIVGITMLDDDSFSSIITIAFYLVLLYFGVRGFNAKSKKYGVLSMVLITIIFIIALFGVYSYNEFLKGSYYYMRYQMSYWSPFIMYVILMIPAIFMCITPRYLAKQLEDERPVFYCSSCGSVFAGSSENAACPKCGENAKKTSITYGIWYSLSDSEKDNSMQRWATIYSNQEK